MKRNRIAWLFILTFLTACAPPRQLEYKTFHNFKIHSLGFNQSTITMDLEYHNPNNFGMQLKNTDLQVFVNNNLLGHSSSDSLIQIPKKGDFILPIRFDVEMRQAFKNAFNALAGKEVTVKLTGRIKAGKGNIFMVVPVNYESRQTFSLFN